MRQIRLYLAVGIAAIALACLPPAPPKPPAPPTTVRAVQMQVTPDEVLPTGTYGMTVDPPFGVQQCVHEGVALTCYLNSNVTPPYGAHIVVTAPGYELFNRDFVLSGEPLQRLPPIVVNREPPPIHVPTKGELMRAQYTFQGLRANCPQYDSRPIPIFDPMIDVVDAPCKAAILQAHRDAGDKVIGVAISHQYSEPGVIPILQAGHDWTNDLPGLHAYLLDIIHQGFYIQLHLAGDGHSVKQGGQYIWNDPVGHTYGCEWLNETWPRIADALDDIHGYIRFLPGYDGVFYGCETPEGQVIEMPKFAAQFKQRYPDGTLGIEFNTGHLPFGEGDSDWQPNGRMWLFDMVFAEFDGDLNQDSTWQIVARLQHNKGDYHRPPEQPAGDDPNPPAYLRNWPGVAVCMEWRTYDDVRFRVTPEQIAVERQKLRAMGCPYTG